MYGWQVRVNMDTQIFWLDFCKKNLNFGGVFDCCISFQGKCQLSKWSLKVSACSRPVKTGDQLGEMDKIVTFSKVFTNVDSDGDSLLTFELGHSKILHDTGWSVKIGTFSLHIGKCPLHIGIFFPYESCSAKRTLRRKLANWNWKRTRVSGNRWNFHIS